MSTPPSEEYLAQVEVRCDAAPAGPWHVDNHSPDLNRWVTDTTGLMEINFGYRGNNNQAEAEFTAHARTDVPTLLAEVRRLRAIVAADVAAANLPPSVERLVSAVREASVSGPVWVVVASLGRIALVRTGESGPEFLAAARRMTLSDAVGRGLLVLDDEVPLPRYAGGGRDWEWNEGDAGQPVRLAGGGS